MLVASSLALPTTVPAATRQQQPATRVPYTAPVRFAAFNASLNRNSAGQLVTDLSTPNDQQAKNVAEIIQRVAPDVVLINEFDYDAQGTALRLFQRNYLGVGQNNALAATYPYSYTAESNTGIASGFDLNNNGAVVTQPGQPGYGDDALGFGVFPGQFGMALYSKYPIDTAKIRTFQKFLWKDMPGALLPDDAATPAASDWYAPEELAIFRLSSKSHWDVPITIGGATIHALVSHPTPPVFDGAEDRNGRRNHDEIRFWADYITAGKGGYVYDDKGATGGLAAGASFVIMGDQNADPNDGDSVDKAVNQLLDNPAVYTAVAPTSLGGPEQAALQGGANATHKSDPAFDTADFADTGTNPGNLRADYTLPSVTLRIVKAGVFWPKADDPLFRLVGVFTPSLPGGFPSSDHRLVWVDVTVPTTIGARVETPPVLDTNNRPNGEPLGDADDPAIYVHPADPAKSMVLGALKDGGLAVYDLDGKQLQAITSTNVRYNNVDLQYDFPLGSQKADIAITTDRRNDKLVIFRIISATRQLEEITDPALGRVFTANSDQDLIDQKTAYGIALYRSPLTNKYYAFITQRSSLPIAQLELSATSAGKVSWKLVRTITLPAPTGVEPDDVQSEGMVADHRNRVVYIAQEKVGIWKFDAEPNGSAQGLLIDKVYPDGGNLKADAEGLTIYNTANGTGYLLASSQGDSTFTVYTREGANTYLGSYRIGEVGGIDSVQNSDGADVVNVPLGPNYPSGLLVVHDGSNDPAVLEEDDGELENVSTNFKFVAWQDLATRFAPAPLAVDTASASPRAPGRTVVYLPVVAK
ncbi:MAG: phytase [Chloroflexales bacterium]|nr:phytase [Chloroflexales bacterium]